MPQEGSLLALLIFQILRWFSSSNISGTLTVGPLVPVSAHMSQLACHLGCRGRIMLSSLPSLKRGLNKSAPDDALTCNIYREGGRRDEVKATLIDAQSRDIF